MDEAGEALFARSIRLLGVALDAWMAQARNDTAGSLVLMQQAVELEATTPKHAVTPAPTLPALEMLGDLLLEQHRPDAALDAYERALTLYPRRFNALLGAARAAQASGDRAASRRYYQQLLDVGANGTRTAVLAEARASLP
jgi:tetratricopeptide (TPR) repeat protein